MVSVNHKHRQEPQKAGREGGEGVGQDVPRLWGSWSIEHLSQHQWEPALSLRSLGSGTPPTRVVMASAGP